MDTKRRTKHVRILNDFYVKIATDDLMFVDPCIIVHIKKSN